MFSKGVGAVLLFAAAHAQSENPFVPGVTLKLKSGKFEAKSISESSTSLSTRSESNAFAVDLSGQDDLFFAAFTGKAEHNTVDGMQKLSAKHRLHVLRLIEFVDEGLDGYNGEPIISQYPVAGDVPVDAADTSSEPAEEPVLEEVDLSTMDKRAAKEYKRRLKKQRSEEKRLLKEQKYAKKQAEISRWTQWIPGSATAEGEVAPASETFNSAEARVTSQDGVIAVHALTEVPPESTHADSGHSTLQMQIAYPWTRAADSEEVTETEGEEQAQEAAADEEAAPVEEAPVEEVEADVQPTATPRLAVEVSTELALKWKIRDATGSASNNRVTENAIFPFEVDGVWNFEAFAEGAATDVLMTQGAEGTLFFTFATSDTAAEPPSVLVWNAVLEHSPALDMYASRAALQGWQVPFDEPEQAEVEEPVEEPAEEETVEEQQEQEPEQQEQEPEVVSQEAEVAPEE